MGRSRIRIPVAALACFLLAMAAAVFADHVSATCEHFVRTYITKPIRNRVSPATAAAWAKWRIGHPRWKPNPKMHRPKYVMTREEAMKKVAFACAIPIIPTDTDGLLPPDTLLSIHFDTPPPILNLPPIEITETTLTDTIPPEVAEIPPDNSGPPLAPFVPPILESPPGPPIVPPTGPVPEPPSLLLLMSGIACLLLLLGARATQAEASTT